MTAEAAATLAPRIAGIDPWHRLAIAPDRLARQFAPRDGVEIRLVTLAEAPAPDALAQNAPVGAVVIRRDWLLGPYLQHLSVLPEAQGHGAGRAALALLDHLARADGHRNAWLCVSAFNERALTFYRRHGFTAAAHLPDLVRPGDSEILMRRRLD
jgi:ribosomal protein S18 acetylase RimI-like enzyme